MAVLFFSVSLSCDLSHSFVRIILFFLCVDDFGSVSHSSLHIVIERERKKERNY